MEMFGYWNVNPTPAGLPESVLLFFHPQKLGHQQLQGLGGWKSATTVEIWSVAVAPRDASDDDHLEGTPPSSLLAEY